jgi:hypothetical protein
MIFATLETLTPGTIYRPPEIIIDNHAQTPQPVYIVRECSLQEYLAETPQDTDVPFVAVARFYEVSMD